MPSTFVRPDTTSGRIQLIQRNLPLEFGRSWFSQLLVGRVYEDAVTWVARFFVAYADFSTPEFTGGMTFLFPAAGVKLAEGKPFGIRCWNKRDGDRPGPELAMVRRDLNSDGTFTEMVFPTTPY